jgi:hypothetical protein
MTSAAAVAVILFAGTVFSIETGYRRGLRERTRGNGLVHEGIGAVEGSSFALLGLLLALSFAAAASRFDAKRSLIIAEANAIGTAYLRVDLLPAEARPAIRELYRRAVDARLLAYEHRGDEELSRQHLATVSEVQSTIWARSVSALATASPQAAILVVPSINEMIDIGTSRAVAFTTHLPGLIVSLLLAAALMSGLLAGYAMAKRLQRSWLHTVAYAGLLAFTVYTVIDLDHPRYGLIRIDSAYQTLSQLRATMDAAAP